MSDQSQRPVETPREWLRYAEGDLRVAEREMESETPTYHTICFLSAELIRAFLGARFTNEGRHVRRLGKVKAMEKE